MAQYCTHDEITRLAIAAAALRNVPEADVIKVIETTSSFVDSFLRQADYVLPLTAWDDAIREATAAIAVWRLLKTRGYNPQDPAHESIRLDYEDKVKWLEQIAAGKVEPDVTDSSGDGGDSAQAAAKPKVISNEQRGWYQRSDEVGYPYSPFTSGRGRG